MESKKSLLLAERIDITDKLYVRNPTVGEILEDEQSYYSFVSSITASPMQFMVQLDDMGVDYTKISDYELFLMLFPAFAQSDLSLVFGDLDMSDATVQTVDNQLYYLYFPNEDMIIDVPAYQKLMKALRTLNAFEKHKGKPGNEHARKYLLDLERKKLKRRANKPYDPYLEKLVIALVNTSEFSYDYDSCMDLSIYRFNQSFQQIQRKINFDNTMHGVFAGTIDTKKMSNKEGLSWIPTDNK